MRALRRFSAPGSLGVGIWLTEVSKGNLST
jgi:hypothetical protein